jgi:hypothetical protein
MKTFGICTILLVVLLLFVIYFIDCNKKKKKRKESYDNNHDYDSIESFNNNNDENIDSFSNINNSRGFNDATDNSGSIVQEKENNNEMNEIIGNNNSLNNANNNYKKNRESSCFPKNQLTAAELLPQDNSSTWAQVNPTGSGTLKDKNFLQAGHHIGINTVGQTLRNANMQLRSEPPNPQVKVSPWLQTTIEPDMGRKPMEIGGCN